MATAPLITLARVVASPELRTPRAANDNIACWTATPRAAALLASCIANPPKGEWKRTRYVQTEDEWFEYVGYRAECLAAIRDEVGNRALLAYDQHGEPAYPAFDAFCRQPNVTNAIDRALNEALDAAREG